MDKSPKTADEWIEAIHCQFDTESDRGAGIVVAAMLEDALRSVLRKRLIPPISEERSILEGDRAPLNTFAAKIDAAFQLGLISRYMARDLHLVRKIRNEFAHSSLERTFEAGRIKDWVTVLEKASDYNRRYPETRAAIGPPGTRWDFLGISAWMLYSLHRDPTETKGLTEHTPEFGYIDWTALPEEIRRLLAENEAT